MNLNPIFHLAPFAVSQWRNGASPGEDRYGVFVRLGLAGQLISAVEIAVFADVLRGLLVVIDARRRQVGNRERHNILDDLIGQKHVATL